MHPHSFYRFSTSSSFPMSDHHDYWRRFHFHRRPSRLLWFTIGAASATVYIMHKESKWNERAMYWNHCYRPPVQQPQENGGSLNQVLRDPLPTVPGTGSNTPTPSPYPYSHPHHHSHWSWGFAKERSFQYPPPPPAPSTAVANGNGSVNPQVPSAFAPPTASRESQSVQTPVPATVEAPAEQAQVTSWGFDPKFDQKKKGWEQEREKLLAKAQDTVNISTRSI